MKKRYKGLMYSVRKPDFVVGSDNDPYLHRWYIIPRNKYFNIYLHHFLRSDDDRALHDHPWWNMSFLLSGSYKEYMPVKPKELQSGNREIYFKIRNRFFLVFRKATASHRIELFKKRGKEIPVWTLFLTGPKIRNWGFWCPRGWKYWEDFVSKREGGNDTGKGCVD